MPGGAAAQPGAGAARHDRDAMLGGEPDECRDLGGGLRQRDGKRQAGGQVCGLVVPIGLAIDRVVEEPDIRQGLPDRRERAGRPRPGQRPRSAVIGPVARGRHSGQSIDGRPIRTTRLAMADDRPRARAPTRLRLLVVLAACSSALRRSASRASDGSALASASTGEASGPPVAASTTAGASRRGVDHRADSDTGAVERAAGGEPPATTGLVPGSVNATSMNLTAEYVATVRSELRAPAAFQVSSTMVVTNTSGKAIDRLELNTIAARLGRMTPDPRPRRRRRRPRRP